jgi:U32 family peptidase
VSGTVNGRRLELLAPAGSLDSLRAAVRNGADAVYLGTTEFNARRGAENFTLETLADACDYAHLRGAKVYLTANIVVLEHEMRDALKMLARAWKAGIDAVIVQDLGLLHALGSALPELRVHASTQIDAHNAPSIQALERLGVSRVTLARELSIAEIGDLAASSPIELESFIHGSLCYCHSGQCFMSSMVGGRSANRGLCAQPCRLPYDIVGSDGRLAEVPGRYLLSPKDLCGIEMLPALLEAGVRSLKVEGRMKSPEYVATVVSVYRAAIDRVLAEPSAFSVRPTETERLEEAFNRGFTQGYLADIRDDRMMSYQRPNNRGVPVGRVVETKPGRAVISLDRSLESGDTIEFWTSTGRFAQPAGELAYADGRGPAAPSGARVTVAVTRPVRPGDRVFRVQNAALIDAARRSWQSSEEHPGVALRFRVRLRVGEPALVEATSSGITVQATGPLVELARTRLVTAEEVLEHVGRLGGTPYTAVGTSVHLDAGVGISFSVLHQLRREAIELLDARRLAPWTSRGAVPVPEPPALPRRSRRPVAPELVVAVSDTAAAAACREAGADRVLIATSFAAITDPRDAALLPRVAHQRDVAEVIEAAEAGSEPIVAGNLGLLAELADKGKAVEADWGLSVVNPWSAAALARLGASALWASPELSGRQLASLVESSPLPVGVLVGGRVELMIAEHCVLQAIGACSHECARCTRRLKRWTLRDRKGYDLPVTTDAEGRAHIYNAVPLDLARALPEIVEAGVAAVRLELQAATVDEARWMTRAWRERLDLTIAGKLHPDAPILEPSTSGLFFRGLH